MNEKLADGLSPRTVQYCHAVLRRALNVAMRRNLVHRNVAALVSVPTVSREPTVPYSVDEARAFLKAAEGNSLEALWVTTLALGLRRGEVLGLKWEALDLDNSRLYVRSALQRQKEAGLVEIAPKVPRQQARLAPPCVRGDLA